MKTQVETQMKNSAAQDPARRKFLKDSAAMAGGLVIGFYLPMKGGRAYAADAPPKPVYPPNAFIRIAPDDSITIVDQQVGDGAGRLHLAGDADRRRTGSRLEPHQRRVRAGGRGV